MIYNIRRKWNPACYQGNNTLSRHFEGWYFKIIDKQEKNLYAIIPGVFKSKNPAESHAFIQIFEGKTNRTLYYRFPLRVFSAHKSSFDIHIGGNAFSSDKILLDLKGDNVNIEGELNFSELTSWPKTFISPGIMGWYTWVPFMECYHGIVSLDHKIEGNLVVNDNENDFSGGRGYTEKDWGRSFPEAWIWCQSNHFSSNNVCLTGSIAIIPWIRKPFLGYIFGLWYQGNLYQFATYNSTKLSRFEVCDSYVIFELKNKKHTLEIRAHRTKGGNLIAPTINGMSHQISESLNSVVELKFSRHCRGYKKILLSDTGRNAGFEIAGNIGNMLGMARSIIEK